MTLVIGRYSGCDWRVFRRSGRRFTDDRGLPCLPPSDWHDATDDEIALLQEQGMTADA